MGIIDELDEIETDVAHRAARFYRFDKTTYDQMAKQGFNFEILGGCDEKSSYLG